MATEATSPSPIMEVEKDAFFFGDLASIDAIFSQYPDQSLPVCVLPAADASSTSSTAPSSPAEVSDPSSCQSDVCPSSAKALEYCPSSDSIAQRGDREDAMVAVPNSNDASAQALSSAAIRDNGFRTAIVDKSKGAISVTPSKNTLTFFPPPGNEHIDSITTLPTSSPVRAETACFSPSFKFAEVLHGTPSELADCMSDSASPAEFRAGDWMCVQSHCSFHNYSRNSMCGRCGALKPSHFSSRPGFAASRAKKGGVGAKWDAALPAFNVPPTWTAPVATSLRSPLPNSGWSSSTLSPADAARLSDGKYGINEHQRAPMISARQPTCDGSDGSAFRRRGCDTPYPRFEAGLMHTPPQQTGFMHSRGPLDMPNCLHQERSKENALKKNGRYHYQGGDNYSSGMQQFHRHNVHGRTQSPSPMPHQTSLPLFPMSPFADSRLPSPVLYVPRSSSYTSGRAFFVGQSPTVSVASKRTPQLSDSHGSRTPHGARTLFGNGSGSDSDDKKRAQASLNDLATTQQLASMGVGVGPGVNPNVEYPISGTAASSDLRSPTIREGPPAPPPIINSGSVGPMLVQAGDWICSHCSFVNWRRRRVCMRCYPFAEGNEIAMSLSNGALLAARVAAGVEIPESELASLTKPRTAAQFDHPRPQTESNSTYAGSSNRIQSLTPTGHLDLQQYPSRSLTENTRDFALSNVAQTAPYDQPHSKPSHQTSANTHLYGSLLARSDIGGCPLDRSSLSQPPAPSAGTHTDKYHSYQAQGHSSPAWLPAPLSSPGAFGLEARHTQIIPPALGSPYFSSANRDGRQITDLLTPSGRAIKDLWEKEWPPSRMSSHDAISVPPGANLRLHFSTTPVKEVGPDYLSPDNYGSLYAASGEAAQQHLWGRREGQNAATGRPAPIGTRPTTSSSSVASSATASSPPKSSQ